MVEKVRAALRVRERGETHIMNAKRRLRGERDSEFVLGLGIGRLFFAAAFFLRVDRAFGFTTLQYLHFGAGEAEVQALDPFKVRAGDGQVKRRAGLAGD